MKQAIRRMYRAVGRRLSARRKHTIKRLGKTVVPQRARARLRRAVQGTRGRIDPTYDPSMNQLQHALTKEVSSLSRALWMGFTTDALAELERIRRSGGVPRRPIARACETLARWYATDVKYEAALDRVIQARILNGGTHSGRLRVLEHHLLAQLDLFGEADRLFGVWGTESPDLHLMQANLLLRKAEAGVVPRSVADRQRVELIDWVFRQESITPVSELVNGEPLTFAALASELPRRKETEAYVAAPIVTVVVPAYNAEATLATSVNSLRAQTLRNIEIVIVDDSSTDGTATVAEQIAEDDSRVKVIQHAQNQGAYGARNSGLCHATGKYFTVHDADDWSHPQLIERQLKKLQESDAVGSFSRLARVTQQMEFLLRPYRPMLEPIHWNYTSLLVKTEAMRAFGGWDTVRAHADSELIERLRLSHGKDSLVETDTTVPLSFFSVSGNNLTEAKDTGLRSVDFGSRREYTEQARYWRDRTFGEGEVPTYEGHRRNGAKVPFYAARSLSPNRDQITQSYDLVIGSDLALTGGTRRCNLAYIDCACELGLSVGVFNAPRYRLRGFGTIDPSYRELFQLDGVDLLSPEDKVSATALLVHHPPVLRHVFDSYPHITADKHYLLVNQLPWQMADFTDIQYDSADVRGNYKDAFGAEPVWISISPRVRSYLAHVRPPVSIHPDDWYPIVNWKAEALPRRQTVGSQPVVGRHSRDHMTKWPEDAELLKKAYLADTDLEVQLLGGVGRATEVLGYQPKNWVVHPFDSVPVEEFVEGIDIFVHYHHSRYIEEFGRNIAEAMAKGVPCVLPPDYEETFHDAAAYAEPNEVERTVRELWADRDRYYDYSERGVAFVEKHSSRNAGMKNITSILG